LAVNNKQFALFADMSTAQDNPAYDFDNSSGASNLNCTSPTAQNECLEFFKITTADYVSGLCYMQNNAETCVHSKDSGSNLYQINILFRRPSPNAQFFVSYSDGSCFIGDPSFVKSPTYSCSLTVPYLKLQITTGSGKLTKSVTVWNTGQIEVL
jgi:hypothetical protein